MAIIDLYANNNTVDGAVDVETPSGAVREHKETGDDAAGVQPTPVSTRRVQEGSPWPAALPLF